jgi:DNA-binding NarL/FixJ family response regulator
MKALPSDTTKMEQPSAAATPQGSRPPTGPRRHVLLADDHDLVRGGIAALIELLPDVEVVAEASSGEELLAVVERVKADLVITDIHMPGMDGLEAVAQIRRRDRSIRILVLSMHDTAEFVQRAVANGANGYLMKNAPPSELQHAVETMLMTGSYFNAKVARLLMERADTCADDGLTDRQLEILSLLASGLSSKEIAYQLGLSAKTVDVHRARIMERVGVRDVASLTRYAVRRGLVKA